MNLDITEPLSVYEAFLLIITLWTVINKMRFQIGGGEVNTLVSWLPVTLIDEHCIIQGVQLRGWGGSGEPVSMAATSLVAWELH